MGAYEDARVIAYAAEPGELSLSAYTGGEYDYAYLKQWVLDQVVPLYSVTASTFDTATVLSTSLLRDFVHRVMWQFSDDRLTFSEAATTHQPGFLGWDDVALGFRTEVQGLCGELTLQL